MTNVDEVYMQRCLQLAAGAQGNVSPNPMVGCVIVHKNQIIGEGFHREYGGPHAEVHAINSVNDQSWLKDSTLYVNLEPCSHYGKTPPCSDLIISKGLKRVVIADSDPNPLVAGSGIKRLQDAGIEVVVGVLKSDAQYLNRRFITFYTEKRPYIILKYARSKDGFIDYVRTPKQVTPAWITNEYCRMLVHKWRCEEDAFMVGTQTVLFDNPQLTSRLWPGKNPLRVSLDEFNQINENYYLLDGSNSSLIFSGQERIAKNNVEFVRIDFSKSVIPQVLDELYKRKIQSLVVEGGALLLQSFIDDAYWDEARIFTGEKQFYAGVKEPVIDGVIKDSHQYGNSSLQIMYPNL